MKSSAMMCCGHTAADINAVKSPRPISAAGSPTTGPASGGEPQTGTSSRGNIIPQHNPYGSVPMAAAGRGTGTTMSAPTPLPANAPAMPRAPPPPPPLHAPPPVANRRGPSPVPSHRATSPSASKRQPTTMPTTAGIETTVSSDEAAAVANASFSNTLRGSRPRAPSVAELSLVRKRSATLPVGGSAPALGRGLSSGRLLPPSASSPFASRSRAATHLMTDDDSNAQATAQGGNVPFVPTGTSPPGTAGAPSWEALHQVQTRSGHATPTVSVINAPPSRQLAQQEQQQQKYQHQPLLPDATLPGNAKASTPVGSTRVASYGYQSELPTTSGANSSSGGAIVVGRQPSRTAAPSPAAAQEEDEFLFSSNPPPIPVEHASAAAPSYTNAGGYSAGTADIDAVFVRSLSSTSATMMAAAVDDQPHHNPHQGGSIPHDARLGGRGGVVEEASPMRPYTLRGALDRGGINNAPPSSEGLSTTMNHHYDASPLNAAPVFKDNRNEQSQALPDSAEISPEDLTSIHASLLVNSQRRQQVGTTQAAGNTGNQHLSQNHGGDGNTVNDPRVPGTTTVSMSVSSAASAGGRSLSSPAVPPAGGSPSAPPATSVPGASTTRVGTAPPQSRPPPNTAVAPPPVAAVPEVTSQHAPVDYPSPQTDRDRLLDALSLPSPPTAATTKAAAGAASRTKSITVLVGDDNDNDRQPDPTNRPLYRDLTAAINGVSQSSDKRYFSTLASVQAYLGRVNMRHEDDARMPTHARNASLSFSPSRDAPHYSSAYATAIAPVPPPTATNLLSTTTSYSVPADGVLASSQGLSTTASPRLINASTPFAVLYPAHRGPAAGDGLHQAACDRMRQQEGLRHATNFRDGSPLGHVPAEEFGRSAYAVPHSPRRIGGVLQREGGVHASSSSTSSLWQTASNAAAVPLTYEAIAQTRQYREEVAFQHRDHNGRYSPPRRLAAAGGAGGAGQLRDTTDLRRTHSASSTSTNINQTNRGGFAGHESPRKPPPVRTGDALSTSSTFQPASFFEGCSADYFKAKKVAVANGPDPMALESSPTRRRDLRVYGNETDTTRREASVLTFPAAGAASFNRGGGGAGVNNSASSSHVFSERFDYHNYADPYRAPSVSSPGAVDRMLAQARAVSEEQNTTATVATNKEWTSSATSRIHTPTPAHPQHHRDHQQHHHQHKESIVLSTPVATSRFHSTDSRSYHNKHHHASVNDRFASTPTEILATARGLLNTPTVSPIVTGGGRRRV